MAPEGKTHLVVEYFCFKEDAIWTATDAALAQRTVRELSGLGIIEPEEVLDSAVLRIPNAYPLFEVDYIEKQKCIVEYLDRFRNLELVGRGGQFEYYNTDHAMESGIAAAKAIMARIDGPVAVPTPLLVSGWAPP
jgi:protoporphyrinogen oxidase